MPPSDRTDIEEVPRERREKLAKAVRALQIREERQKQSNPRGGLMEFIRYFWHVLEPVDPFIEGWPLECLCAHLEAISRGETIEINGVERPFNRLNANVSPGFMKSLTVNVFWAAWEWGPLSMPHLRYIAFSYSSALTERDNAKFRDLICSPEYQELWGHVFSVVGDGKIRVTNDKTGFKFASSIGGVGTGERGHRILCFAGDQKVLTERGAIPIQEIVDRKMQVQAWSFNEQKNAMELRPIVGWHRNPGRPLLKLTLESGASLTCTHDHKIYTATGKMAAALLGIGDAVLSAPMRALRQIEMPPGLARPDGPDGRRMSVEPLAENRIAFVRRMDGSRLLLSQPSLETLSRPCGEHKSQAVPLAPAPDAVDGGSAGVEVSGDLVNVGWGVVLPQALGDLAHKFLGQVRRAVLPRAVSFAIFNVLCSRTVLKVAQSAIASVAVKMTDIMSLWARPNERLAYEGMHKAIVTPTIAAQSNARIPIHNGGPEELSLQVHDMVSVGVRDPVAIGPESPTPRRCAGKAADTADVGHLVQSFKPDNWSPEFDRVVSVEPLHDIPPATYCVTVEGNHNLFCGEAASVLAANCDDLNKIKGTQESDDSRNATSTWALEAMQNRLNDLQRDVIINIQQRTHENDVSGTLLENLGSEYCALIIPMEYESGRHFSHYKGWNNGEDPRTEDGELAWPERYPMSTLQSYKRNNYLWSGQYQQRPSPRGGGIFKEHWFQPYEVPTGGTYAFVPRFILASLDTAFKEKEENDYNALTIWYVYDDPKTKNRKILLADAWKKRLPLHGERVERHPNETDKTYAKRASPKWGLVEWVHFTCMRRRVNRLVIEDSSRGHDLNAELRRVFSGRDYGIRLLPPRGGDKWARAQAVVDLFTDEMIFAPGEWIGEEWRWRDWMYEVINELCAFPRGTHDDLVDAVTLGLKHLRECGLAIRREERELADEIASRYKQPSGPLYPV